jgi:hypothetical protein
MMITAAAVDIFHSAAYVLCLFVMFVRCHIVRLLTLNAARYWQHCLPQRYAVLQQFFQAGTFDDIDLSFLLKPACRQALCRSITACVVAVVKCPAARISNVGPSKNDRQTCQQLLLQADIYMLNQALILDVSHFEHTVPSDTCTWSSAA